MEIVLVLIVAVLFLVAAVKVFQVILPFLQSVLNTGNKSIAWLNNHRPHRPSGRDRKGKPEFTHKQMREWMAYTASMVYAAGIEGWELLPPEVMGRNRIVIQKDAEMREFINGEWVTFGVQRVGFSRNTKGSSDNGKIPKSEFTGGGHWADNEDAKQAIKKALLKYRELVNNEPDDKKAVEKLWNLIRARMFEGQTEPFDKMNEFKGNKGQAIERIHKVFQADLRERNKSASPNEEDLQLAEANRRTSSLF